MRRLRGTDAVAALIFANAPGQQAVPLVSAWDLNSFSWIQRGTVQDMMAFMAKVRSVSCGADTDGLGAHDAGPAPVDPGEHVYGARVCASSGRRSERRANH